MPTKHTSILPTNTEGIGAPITINPTEFDEEKVHLFQQRRDMYEESSCLGKGSYDVVVMVSHRVIDKVHISSRSMLLSIDKVLEMVHQAALRHELEGCQLLVAI
jgi:hypothetical protein